jgi:probable phosphoglycerate mutase
MEGSMKDRLILQQCLSRKVLKAIGLAADHSGHELKEYLAGKLRDAGAKVIDFGDRQPMPDDDYPDFVVPLAHAVAAGQVERGVAICGSGVGACIAANKVRGVRACLIHDPFSAHQGVEDDDLNMICLGGLVVGHALAWELVATFLIARFSGEERHRRRLAKVADLENQHAGKVVGIPVNSGDDPSDSSVTISISGVGIPANSGDDPRRASFPHGEKHPSDAMSLHLYLIRHGETEWSLTSQHTGSTDIPLTPRGEEEARELAPELKGIPFRHVFTSPRKRARQTCDLASLETAPEIEPDLAEWDYGDYEGKKSVDIRQTRPDWNIFRDGCPNGELPAQVLERTDRLIARLRTLHGNVALFSHGQFGCVLAARWLGLPLVDARHFLLGTASLSMLGFDPDHPEVPVISLWNSVSHQASDPTSDQHAHGGQPARQRAIQRWENEGGEIPIEQRSEAQFQSGPIDKDTVLVTGS